MKNVKTSVKDGILKLSINIEKEGELSSTGASRKIAYTDRFEPIKIGDEEYGLMLMLTKKTTRSKKKDNKDD